MSPGPSSLLISLIITTTVAPGPCLVEMKSAEDKLSSSYISKSNIGWIDMVTKEQLDNITSTGQVMIQSLQDSNSKANKQHESRMAQHEGNINSLYTKLAEATAKAEAAATSSSTHTANLNVLQAQYQQTQDEIKDLTQKAYNKIIALKVAQLGSQDSINLLTTQIYINLLERATAYKGTARQELLKKIKTKCSSLTNAIV